MRKSYSTDKEAKFTFNVDCWSMKLGDNAASGYSTSGCDSQLAVQTVKLKVENGNIKIYVNGSFVQSWTLEQPNKTYAEWLITGIDSSSDKIYTMKINNLGSSSTPITSPDTTNNTATLAAEFDKGKKAGIQQCVTNPSSCGITVSTTTSPSTTTTEECVANYSANGELHIPCVNVPGAFGKIEMYDVWMQQRSGAFTFDLDLDRIEAR